MTRPAAPRCRQAGSLLAVAAALLTSTSFAPQAQAAKDKRGSLGRVVGMRVVTQGSHEHASYHGFIRIKPPLADPETYYWGGSSCPGQKITDAQLQLLVTALRDQQQLQLRPYYYMGEAADRCLVAFDLVAG
ncbi:MAG: hypothetical protein AAF799_10355 [Myxococcota bacterium]